MAIFAIADLHLAIGIPEKSMEAFGEPWINYQHKIKTNWESCISKEDLVLIAGDISWAMRPVDARVDLEWIAELPGTKVILRGNHDYWWTSLKQIHAILPPTLHLIQNNSFFWNDVAVGGARLWDTSEYNFGAYIQYQENPKSRSLANEKDLSPDAEKIFERELGRLELSLKSMQAASAKKRIVMTHYPPISATLEPSRASQLLEKYRVDICVFGHLHSLRTTQGLFGTKNGITYYLTAADALNFKPLKIGE